MANKVTQNAKVLHWLQKNGELTTREAVTELNIMASRDGSRTSEESATKST